jgi:hypothetical protein
MHRTYFNAIDVNDELALGRRRVCAASPSSLPMKIWLSTLAISLANAYLIHMKKHKLSTD